MNEWVIQIYGEKAKWKTLRPFMFEEKIDGRVEHHNGAFTGDELERLGWFKEGKYISSRWHYTLEESISIGVYLRENWENYVPFRLLNIRTKEVIPCEVL